MIKISILILKYEELLLIFLQKINLLLKLGDNYLFLVYLDFERGVEVWGS